MEVPQVFCLSSKQFESRMRSNLNELRVGKDFCDVTIACEDQEIEAHKVVLAGGSLLFNNLLKQNPHHHPFIFLRGINFSFLSKILDFLYQGEVYIDTNELDDFLSVAKDLKINGLTEDSKHSKHFVEEGAKKKRPRLVNSPEQDLNLDDNGIENDFGSEPITDSFVNTEDDDVEKVILPNQLVAETPLTFLSSDQKVKGKLRIRDIAKLTKNPLQIKPCTIEQETSKNDFICEQCNKNYCNKYFLKSHIDSVHNGVLYSCEECNFKTKWKQSLKIHIDSSHNGESYSCEKCDFKATREEILKIHIDSTHRSNQSQEGSKKKRQRLLGIGRNLCFEVKKDDFGYEPITQSFVDFGDNNEDADVEKVSLPDKPVVEKHLRVDIRKLRMEDIENLIKNPLQIQSFSKEKKTSENDFICEQCNKKFAHKWSRKCHIDSVHNGNDFTCEQCNKKYAHKRGLKSHNDSVHSGVLHFCEKCDYTATGQGQLKRHILSIHNGNRSGYEGVLYSCELCDHKANKKINLERHIKSSHKGSTDL